MDARASSSSASSILFLAAIVAAYFYSSEAAVSKGSFEDNFSIMWSEDHFTTSKDGQIWYLSLDKDTGTKCKTLKFTTLLSMQCVFWFDWRIWTVSIKFEIWGCFWSNIHCLIGCGFQTKQRYRFGWFSMKLKLVAGDSAGVVTAYYVSVKNIEVQ